MLKSHERFHSANGKRLILVADDEFVNREILKNILQDEYELVFSVDGQETLDMIRANKEALSLVLLDINMPVMSGLDVLRQVKADPEVSHIPVIVVTSDQDAEVESLTIGAIDFIPKPYPQIGVIKARVLRTIELSEDREIINSTERDELTGLYNREYFYSYVEQYDQHHKDTEMDALVVDVNHFNMINERFGKAYGDSILRRIGETLRETIFGMGGMVCRREADTFLIYCPHCESYADVLEQASIGLSGKDADDTRAWLRMGVYAHVDKSLDVERRFDRAKMAADTVQGSFTRTIGVYDNTLHERELYAEQLVEDFPTAIKEHQFKVHYQPKFDIRPEVPTLSSAEALVRWDHPTFGMISPSVFVPLFEDNGLVQKLDQYVWREVVMQIKDWKERIGCSVPVSVNVSRIDMYDPHLVDTMQNLLVTSGLAPKELFLEITESAYTDDSEQIIETVNELRGLGFRIEMDDFGTGYSSLNMISKLPIDVLKLDMGFIRSAFCEGSDTRMLEVIVDIADYLLVPVIAEGVETEEQMLALREIGCDYVQGYYFSRPVLPAEFEKFLVERTEQLDKASVEVPKTGEGALKRRESVFEDIVHALAADYFSFYYVNSVDERYIEYNTTRKHRQLAIERSGEDFFVQGRESVLSAVHPDDYSMVNMSFTRENIMSELDSGKTFTLTYRLLLDGKPTYVHLKASAMENNLDKHIAIGISDVDGQIRREQEYARILRMSNQDELTGVKSGYAYADEVRKINQAISRDEQVPFAVVACDINGLRGVNDSLGHRAGDEYVKRACSVICHIFKHSPVYRVGGDEFVAILRGGDYEMRDELMAKLYNGNRKRAVEGGILIAGGMSEFVSGKDKSIAAVFKRADAMMAEDKEHLKAESV